MNLFRFLVPIVFTFISIPPSLPADGLLGGQQNWVPNERSLIITNDAEVCICVNTPSVRDVNSQKVTLVFYALPNGNTIEQTIGKQCKAGDDWHFNIQHIGAQTRYLRHRFKNEQLVVAYLGNNLKSWPAWRKKHGDLTIPALLDSVKERFKGGNVRIVLTGHSGGGSLIFGFINAVGEIPADVERIAFLDSNYAYDTALHYAKLKEWLLASTRHSLVVMAYQDSVALLNGKTFVSETGGTWGKSRQMRQDLMADFPFLSNRSGELETATALDHRIIFLLRSNPEKKIWHTVQVELNGFIHALLAGSSEESKGYRYLGERVYGEFIQPE